ncbi:MAG: hypothetical protein CR991_09545 [Proteobacteria bacterium]|nr:MAG: hypothetical protein CR991_09545 [Pseudomonadota bacterium]
MSSYSLVVTLGTGVLSSFTLFFVLYKLLGWNNKLAALITILLIQAIYIPLAVLDWPGLDVFAIHFAFFVMSAYGLGIITSHRMNRQRLNAHLGVEDKDFKEVGWFHWGPATIIGFFLLLAVVDSTIITLASRGASADFMGRFLPEPRKAQGTISSSFPGTVADDYQEKYDQFNHYLSRLVEQKERGWEITGGWQDEPKLGEPMTFAIEVRDSQGQPITGSEVEVQFLRPADKRLDKRFTLSESGNGQYGNRVALDAPGKWMVVVVVRRGGEIHELKGETLIDKAG